MTRLRFIIYAASAVVLTALVSALVILILVESAERGRRHGEQPAPSWQSIPFKGERK